MLPPKLRPHRPSPARERECSGQEEGLEQGEIQGSNIILRESVCQIKLPGFGYFQRPVVGVDPIQRLRLHIRLAHFCTHEFVL